MNCQRCMGSGFVTHRFWPISWKSECPFNHGCVACRYYDEGILLISPPEPIPQMQGQRVRSVRFIVPVPA